MNWDTDMESASWAQFSICQCPCLSLGSRTAEAHWACWRKWGKSPLRPESRSLTSRLYHPISPLSNCDKWRPYRHYFMIKKDFQWIFAYNNTYIWTSLLMSTNNQLALAMAPGGYTSGFSSCWYVPSAPGQRSFNCWKWIWLNHRFDMKSLCWVTLVPLVFQLQRDRSSNNLKSYNTRDLTLHRQAAMYHICLTTAIKAPASNQEAGEKMRKDENRR